MKKIDLMADLSEIVHYEHADVPLYIRTASLSAYPDLSAPCHWHDDIEWIHILKGKMRYYINGKRILLNERDLLMVNARQMHYGYSYEREDCHFCCILFHPSLFCDNRFLFEKYVAPVLKNTNLEYVHLRSDCKETQELSGFLAQMVRLKEQGRWDLNWKQSPSCTRSGSDCGRETCSPPPETGRKRKET